LAYFPDSFLQDLKDRCLVEDVVSHYVELKKAGTNLVGLCPFHREKTPSFTVSPDKQIFHCFGCSFGGDVFHFIMRIENVDFVEAVSILAKRAGVALPQTDGETGELHKKRQRMVAIHKEAARFFYQTLSSTEGQKGLSYLRRRQIKDATIRKFGLGFARDSWDSLTSHLLRQGYGKAEIVEAGLGIKGKTGAVYDRFRNRVMFPIINIRGEVIAFGGRVMDASMPKYLNSPETLIFNKRRNLFSLNLAKNTAKEQGILLVEGYMDVLSLYQAGFTSSVASLGTALTFEQAKLISRYATHVTIAYDSDAAGQAATQKAIEVLKRASVEIKVLKIEGGKDPDEYITTYGADRFALLLAGSDNDITYRMERLRQGFNLNDIVQKTRFLEQLVEILSQIDSSIERELYVRKAAEQYEISQQALEAELKKIQRKKRKGLERENKKNALANLLPQSKNKEQDGREGKGLKAQEMLLALLYENPSAYPLIKDRLAEEDFSQDNCKEAFLWMKRLWERGEKPDLLLGTQELQDGVISALTQAISRQYEFSSDETVLKELMDDIKANSLKKEAMNTNSEDMREMVRWYNQVKNKKSK
jgi:DNA primase